MSLSAPFDRNRLGGEGSTEDPFDGIVTDFFDADHCIVEIQVDTDKIKQRVGVCCCSIHTGVSIALCGKRNILETRKAAGFDQRPFSCPKNSLRHQVSMGMSFGDFGFVLAPYIPDTSKVSNFSYRDSIKYRLKF